MMRSALLSLRAWTLAGAALLCGCSPMNSMLGGNSSSQALAGLKWDYADNAITIDWRAVARLNAYDGEAHTITLIVAQVSDPNVFRKASATPQQLTALLLATTPPAGVLDLQRFFIHPGQSSRVSLARAQGAQYVGVAVGYYALRPELDARLFQIGVQVKSSGWVVKTRVATPVPLAISLDAGETGLLGGQPDKPVPASSATVRPGSQVPLSAAASTGTSSAASTAASTTSTAASTAASAIDEAASAAGAVDTITNSVAPVVPAPANVGTQADGAVDTVENLMHLAPLPASAPQ